MSNSWITVIGRWTWRGLRVVALLAIVGGVVYWIKFAPVPVARHEIQRGEIVAEVMGTGTLEARVKTTVSPKIAGRIADVAVDQGDRVKAGQPLVRLDDEELRQQVAIAQASRETEEATVARLTTDKERATAVYDQARMYFRRVEDLFARNVSSREELERATEALAVAQAGASHAEAAIVEGRKELLTAEKTLEYQKARLADTVINAPFEGLIVKRQRDPGDIVLPGSSTLTLISTDELWISAWVDETEMVRLAEGQSARVVFRSNPDRSYPGKVARMGKEADRETREFLVDVHVLELPSTWAIGQRAEVYIETARAKDVPLLPARFVVWRDDQPGAFVDQDGRALWKPLKLGLRGPDMVQVIEGVGQGEAVVVPSDAKLTLTDGRGIVTP
jgi:RND family efflux transporter MFP subunit